MIPVTPQPEPTDFEQRVRAPGRQLLARIPHPTTQQWKGSDYWVRALPDLRAAYGGICAYCACWIPYSTGSHSVDHFVPKSRVPGLAYEWSNFRYVSARFNSRKATRQILDPFQLAPHWFVIQFKTYLVEPNPDLPAEHQELVWTTIDCLRLNDDDDLVNERQSWYQDYVDREISFAHLRKKAPFIASELERQGLLLEDP